MKAMALNSVQNSKSTVETAQVFAAISKSIEEYSKNENLLMTVAIICALVVMLGVMMMNAVVMISGVALLVLGLTPAIVRWAKKTTIEKSRNQCLF